MWLLAQVPGCAGTRSGGAAGDAASKVYVKPGEHDAYYGFLSGGHHGNIYVYGFPSCRHITTIPVFTPEPAVGYGYDEESKAMLGGRTWGDAHHPGLSETDGDYDGRWLFINDMVSARIARIDLKDFKTKQIYGPIPNLSAAHACPFPTPNTEYVFAASRFSVPVPNRAARIEDYAKDFRGIVAGIKVDPKDGTMSMGFEVLMPPFDWDLADAGKGPSAGWEFFTCYNSEMAYDSLEVKASQNEMDYIAAVDWRVAQKAVDEGKATTIGGAPVLDPKDVPGLVYLIPTPKSPHGVDVEPERRVHLRLRQAAGRGHGVQLQEVPGRGRGQEVRRRPLRHPGAQVRGLPRGQGAGRPGAAAHPVRRQGQRLHLAVPRLADRRSGRSDRPGT